LGSWYPLSYAIADGIFNLLYPDKTALRGIKQISLDDFQLCFDFSQIEELRELQQQRNPLTNFYRSFITDKYDL